MLAGSSKWDSVSRPGTLYLLVSNMAAIWQRVACQPLNLWSCRDSEEPRVAGTLALPVNGVSAIGVGGWKLYFLGTAAAAWVASVVHPAPRALIRDTLAASRCPLNWTTVCSCASDELWAMATSR